MTTPQQRLRKLGQSIADVWSLLLIGVALLAIALSLGLGAAHGETVADLLRELQPLDQSAPVKVRDGSRLADPKLTKDFDGTIIVSAAAEVVVPPIPPSGARNVYGDFILQPLFHGDRDRYPPKGDRLVDENELRLPGVDGLTIRIIPTYLSVNGKWDFTFIDQCVQRCRNTGDRYTLLLAGGGSNPLAEANLKFYESAAAALGARYASDPLCVGAHIAGTAPTGHSEELFWGRQMPTAAKVATRRMIDAWTVAFPAQVKLLAGSAQDPAAMRELITYGIQRTGGRFLYKNNAMSAQPNLDWEGNTLVTWCGKQGGHCGFEMVGSWTYERSRFGGSYEQMLAKVSTLLARAGKKPTERYLAHYPPDINLVGKAR